MAMKEALSVPDVISFPALRLGINPPLLDIPELDWYLSSHDFCEWDDIFAS